MGFFDDMKANRLGQKAYSEHVAGNDLIKRGKPQEAEAKFDSAAQLYQEAFDAGCRKVGTLMSWSVLLMRCGEFEKAREVMKEAAKDKSMNEDTHFELRVNYSICLWRLGLLDDAIMTIRYAGKHAKNGSYYSSLGTYLVEKSAQTGEFEETKALLDEAMEYDDEDAATLDNLGEYYRLRSKAAKNAGDAEAAKELRAQSKDAYERAHEQRPGQITTLYALAKFAQEDGEIDKARDYIDRAIARSGSKMCPISAETLKAFRAEL